MKRTIHLRDAQQGHTAFVALWLYAKSLLLAGHQLVAEIRPRKRSDDQSDKFHAMCGDFAKSGIAWAGKARTPEQWKVLLISGHAVATKIGAEMVPGLEGEFCNIRESSAQMSTARMSSLIEYTNAMAAQMGVHLSAPEE